MTQNIMLLENPEFGRVRMIYIDGKEYFMANDVAKALGYTKPNNAISQHCRATLKQGTPISGKIQEVNYIPEGDVYRLIIRSKLPKAVEFEKWLFDEVLPTIRKNGVYVPKETIEQVVNNPNMIVELVTRLKTETDKRIELEQEIKRHNKLVTMKSKPECLEVAISGVIQISIKQ